MEAVDTEAAEGTCPVTLEAEEAGTDHQEQAEAEAMPQAEAVPQKAAMVLS